MTTIPPPMKRRYVFLSLLAISQHCVCGLILSRRDALELAGTSGSAVLSSITSSSVVTTTAPTTDVVEADAGTTGASSPYPFLTLNTGFAMPAVGYSFYKTPDKIDECVDLALAAGVRHFDCASQYGTNRDIGPALRASGVPRSELFLTHKIAVNERSIQSALKDLQTKYLDLCMIHSPVNSTPKQRLVTYKALLDFQKVGLVRSVGVCHYGVQPLQEIVDANLPAPSVIQLQLSPFNQHLDIAQWAASHGSALCCSAWSRLSSVDGPQEGWAVVSDIAKQKKATKAQILVRWALQKGYVCVPRSSANSKVERQAIAENSFQGCSGFVLSDDELTRLDQLDVQLPAGQLGVTDGYRAADIVSRDWDPTTAIV